MNGPDVVTLAAAFVLVLAAGAAIMRWLLGPDPDLDGWEPGDPPDFRRPPCGERTCRIDHEAVRPWISERMR